MVNRVAAAVAGGGGHLYFFTLDASISMAGKLYLRGGAAPDDGGTGGLGGAVDIFCDKQANGYGGNLTIEPAGFIDASGGPGTIGGSGRNDGGWGIALFPEEQEQLSVLLNSDGIHGSPKDGVLLNLGTIITKGGAGDGWGGDVMFHGRGMDTDRSAPRSRRGRRKRQGPGRPGRNGIAQPRPRASGLGPRASGLGPRASGLGLGPRASGLGPRASASGLGPRASGLGPRASGLGPRASGLGPPAPDSEARGLA